MGLVWKSLGDNLATNVAGLGYGTLGSGRDGGGRKKKREKKKKKKHHLVTRGLVSEPNIYNLHTQCLVVRASGECEMCEIP